MPTRWVIPNTESLYVTVEDGRNDPLSPDIRNNKNRQGVIPIPGGHSTAVPVRAFRHFDPSCSDPRSDHPPLSARLP